MSQTLVIIDGPKKGRVVTLKDGRPVGLGASGVTVGLDGAVAWVRGAVEQPYVLHPGDTLTVGDNVYRLRVEALPQGLDRLKTGLQTLRALPTRQNSSLRYLALIVESFALTTVALMFVSTLGVQFSGLFGLFLAAASLTPRFQVLLQENKDLIFVEKAGSFPANRLTALSILMMFVGLCLAFIGLVVFGPEADPAKLFGLLFDQESGSLLTQEFGAFLPIFVHNLMVMGSIATMCLVYRAYGALLTLGYNAAVWVIVLSSLTSNLLGADPIQNMTIIGWSLLSIAPHLLMEGAAYVMIALAAVFYSKGFTRYMLPIDAHQPVSQASVFAAEKPKDSVFFDISMVCIKMSAAAVVMLLLATAVEAFYADYMLDVLGGWLGA